MPVDSNVIQQGPIFFDKEKHEYWHENGTRLASVSRVINAIYPKKSWDETRGTEREWYVENARIRGERVDQYLSEYVTSGTVSTVPGERQDVIERVGITTRILDQAYGACYIEAQQIVYSLDDGVAGTVDFSVNQFWAIVDLKCCYSTEKSWKLQIGAYSTYSSCQHAGVIHVSPSVYRKEGGVYIPYDVEECKAIWKRGIAWYKTMQRLTHGEKEKGTDL